MPDRGRIMFFSEGNPKGLRLDPRTKLVLFLAVIVGAFMNSSGRFAAYIFPAMCAVPVFMLAISGLWKRAAVFMLVFIAFWFLQKWAMTGTTGFLQSFLALNCYIVLRFFPTAMMGMYMMSTTRVSEFMAAMQRMHVTDKITIPMAVLFRFFPTLTEEMRAINDCMRMRGILLGGKKASRMLEYRIVPLMMCSAGIGEELSRAALTRGLKSGMARTNCCRIGFGPADAAVMLFSIAAIVLTGVK